MKVYFRSIKYHIMIFKIMENLEVWKDVFGYEGSYQVSSFGRVKSLNYRRTNTESILKQHKTQDGYLMVGLHRNGLKTSFRVNRLVAINFIPNPENKADVGHIFGDKSDNTTSSLRWETRKENMIHAVEFGLIKGKKGITNIKAKLTEKQVLEIRASNLTQVQLAKIYNLYQGGISAIITRKYWTHI